VWTVCIILAHIGTSYERLNCTCRRFHEHPIRRGFQLNYMNTRRFAKEVEHEWCYIMCVYRLKCNTVTPLTFRVTGKGIGSLSLSLYTTTLSESLFLSVTIRLGHTCTNTISLSVFLAFTCFHTLTHPHWQTLHGVVLFWLQNKRRFIASLSLINGHSHTLWDNRKTMQSKKSEDLICYWKNFSIFVTCFAFFNIGRSVMGGMMISIIIYNTICRYTRVT